MRTVQEFISKSRGRICSTFEESENLEYLLVGAKIKKTGVQISKRIVSFGGKNLLSFPVQKSDSYSTLISL